MDTLKEILPEGLKILRRDEPEEHMPSREEVTEFLNEMDATVDRVEEQRANEELAIERAREAAELAQVPGYAGTKFDADKLPVDLVPGEAIEAIAQVLDFGRKKYTENGWQSVPDAQRRYFAAALRHMIAFQKGEHFDPDSGLPHLDHALCNLAFLAFFDRQPVPTTCEGLLGEFVDVAPLDEE